MRLLRDCVVWDCAGGSSTLNVRLSLTRLVDNETTVVNLSSLPSFICFQHNILLDTAHMCWCSSMSSCNAMWVKFHAAVCVWVCVKIVVRIAGRYSEPRAAQSWSAGQDSLKTFKRTCMETVSSSKFFSRGLREFFDQLQTHKKCS